MITLSGTYTYARYTKHAQVGSSVYLSGEDWLQTSKPIDFISMQQGLSFSFWFRYNGTATASFTRVFDFGNGAAKGNVLAARLGTYNGIALHTYNTAGDSRQNYVMYAFPTGE